MTEKFVKQNRALDWLGVVASTGALAYVQWILIRDSVEQPQIPILIRYILIDFTIFSMTLIIGIKLLGSSMNRLLRCLLVGLIGAIISTALIDLPYFYQDLPNWPGDSAGWLMHATNFMVLNIFIVMSAITVVFGTGFIVRAALNLAWRRTSDGSGLAGSGPLWTVEGAEPLKRSVMPPRLSKHKTCE